MRQVQTTQRRSTRQELRGFTLIELVTVVVILALLAGIAIPRFGTTLTRHGLEAAAIRITNDLELAQRRARISSQACQINFYTGTHSYELDGVPDLNHPDQDWTVQLDEAPYEVQLASADFGGDATLIFNGYGVPDSGGYVRLRNGGFHALIGVNADTAGIRWTVSGTAPAVADLEPVELPVSPMAVNK